MSDNQEVMAVDELDDQALEDAAGGLGNVNLGKQCGCTVNNCTVQPAPTAEK